MAEKLTKGDQMEAIYNAVRDAFADYLAGCAPGQDDIKSAIQSGVYHAIRDAQEPDD